MSLNSFVTADGGEMGRAQVVQARAAGVEPEVAMNPVLLKPGTDTTSQIIVLGHPVGELDSSRNWSSKAQLLDLVVDAYRLLASRHDVVICEGAGSPAEINLRDGDIVNFGFARAANVPAVLVGDIDRGGLFASLIGTMAVLDHADQDLVQGFIVNKFRGSKDLLQAGIDRLGALTDRPTFGVVPYRRGLELDTEDATDFSAWADAAPPQGEETLSVGVVVLPRASNLTDVDPLVGEPGVVVRPLYGPEEMRDCDLVIVPGTRATVSDLHWLRARGFADSLARRASEGRAILGICGGYQMLGRTIDDEVESASGRTEGLGLLPVCTEFERDKVLAQVVRVLDDGEVVRGYQIHHGRVTVDGGEPFFADEGCRVASVVGTTWHGLFENDVWRRRFLVDIATRARRRFVPANDHCFADRREARIDALADLVEENLDVAALSALLSDGVRPARRAVTLGLGAPLDG